MILNVPRMSPLLKLKHCTKIFFFRSIYFYLKLTFVLLFFNGVNIIHEDPVHEHIYEELSLIYI